MTMTDPLVIEERIKARLGALRAEMAKNGLDALLVPKSDEYFNEYMPESEERVKFLSGFTGSAGGILVTQDNAYLFTDGRYTEQARQQVPAPPFTCITNERGSPFKEVERYLKAGMRVGADFNHHSVGDIKTLKRQIESIGAGMAATAYNLVNAIWADRPAPPQGKAIPYPILYAGRTSQEKRDEIAAGLRADGIGAALISDTASVAWLLNIRGSDLAHTPVTMAHAILNADGTVDLFLDETKRGEGLAAHLGADVRLHPAAALPEQLAKLGAAKTKVRLSHRTVSAQNAAILSDNGAVLDAGDDPCEKPKAIKNETEIHWMREAHRKDGLALVKFFAWLEKQPVGTVDELQAEQVLESFRAQGEGYQGPSFDTIAGSGPNGAIIHYRATAETNRTLNAGELFLLDSGGQYLGGTTDVTRTIAIGRPSEAMRRDFTLALKGHIAIATARFAKGVKGADLDPLARAALKLDGKDYAHGTGHGIGSYLGVHEGPQYIAGGHDTTPLETGMMVSNEPGFYKVGEYGIRHESIVLVKAAEATEEYPEPRHSFETLTLAPFDRRLINTALLTHEEIAWLNAYHDQVFDRLSADLPAAEKQWLRHATAPLVKSLRTPTPTQTDAQL